MAVAAGSIKDYIRLVWSFCIPYCGKVLFIDFKQDAVVCSYKSLESLEHVILVPCFMDGTYVGFNICCGVVCWCKRFDDI